MVAGDPLQSTQKIPCIHSSPALVRNRLSLSSAPLATSTREVTRRTARDQDQPGRSLIGTSHSSAQRRHVRVAVIALSLPTTRARHAACAVFAALLSGQSTLYRSHHIVTPSLRPPSLHRI